MSDETSRLAALMKQATAAEGIDVAMVADDEGVHLRMNCPKCSGLVHIVMTPDQADELSADIRTYSIDARNGGVQH